MNTPSAPPSRTPRWLPFVGAVLAYLVVGELSLQLAIPPGIASPLFPAAGVALACVLSYGLGLLPAIFAASFALNLLHGTALLPGADAGVLAASLAAGATLQAAAAALLVRRWCGPTPSLAEPREIAAFYGLGALLPCVVSATVDTLAMRQAGVTVDGAATQWWTLWTGDALGVLVGAPVALTLIGRPRAAWAHRRMTVGLALVVVTGLLAAAASAVARWDAQRLHAVFERDASRTADALTLRLREPLHALAAVHGLFIASDEVTRHDMRVATQHWLQQPMHIQALGWAQRVPKHDVEAFEADVRQLTGHVGYRVRERADKPPHADADTEVLAVRYIEPEEGNLGALGINVLSNAAARDAIAHARRSGLATASRGFRLSQERGNQIGVVVYRAVYAGAEPADEAQRDAQTAGVVFVTLRMEDAVHSAMDLQPAYLRWCLVEAPRDTPGSARRLAGAAGCERPPAAGLFSYAQAIDFAGQRWEVVLTAPPEAVPEERHWNAWLFSVVGLMATAVLGALLLTVTGRARRIALAVDERTADLRHEVAERRRTEAALRESEQRFRNILDHVPTGIVFTDLDGRIRETNPKLRQLVGYTGAELAAMNLLDLVHPDDRDAERALITRVRDGALPAYRLQKRCVAKDGHLFWVQHNVSVLRDEFGQPRQLVGVVEDITEHLKRLEAERAREHAEAASQAKSDFVSRMSHELRTPLNAMLGFAQLLELDPQAPLPPHQREWAAQIQQAGWHLLHMINDTLDLSRIEAGSLRLEMQTVPVPETVDATVALVEQLAQRRGVRIERTLDPLATSVVGDATRVKQILTNLLSNAVKYNVDGGRVEVHSRRTEGQVEIEVHDTGIGMDERELSELFQPFNRLGRERLAEGTGIGLVISRRLAELMGGTLHVESQPGVGTCFRLTLAAAAGGRAQPALPAEAPAPAHYHQRLVIYIEDNAANAEVMRGITSRRPQVRLQVHPTGLDGLAAIRQQRPSLVLLDMHLPDIDGLELLRHLQSEPATAEIPVVVVSADATRDRIEQARAIGAVAYLTKPVNVSQMLATLDEQLEASDTRFGTEWGDAML